MYASESMFVQGSLYNQVCLADKYRKSTKRKLPSFMDNANDYSSETSNSYTKW